MSSSESIDAHRVALEAALERAREQEVPSAADALRVARAHLRLGDLTAARRWALAVVDGGDEITAWQAAGKVLDKCAAVASEPRRRARIAVLGSATTSQLVDALRVAAARLDIEVELYESHYGQYRQDVLDPASELYRFAPDVVVLAVHEGDLGFADVEADPAAAVDAELARWTSLWQLVAARIPARVVQFNFAVPDVAPFGHLATRLPGARSTLIQALDLRLGEAAGTAVSILDCERLSALLGKERWFDPRYWHLSKQAVALGAVPFLARHLAAIVAADLGLSKKCLVLDLDNTLWGGVVGEDGLHGIRIGGDAEGEAYAAFQEYLLTLRRRGVILAVCSKNNEADAKEPFEQHPEMRLRLSDIAVFVANWESKPDQLRQIAKILDIGIDALVFVDDNPVEREAMRQLCPEVDVVALPTDPALYVRALSQYLALEPASFTPDDAKRAEQYQARAAAALLEASASSLDEFLESLAMRAEIAPIGPLDVDRVVQLIGKTNQFNLTGRRHPRAQVDRFLADPACVHFTLRLADRFADHGLVSVLVAVPDGAVLDVDTWLMSCRVIGRTVEHEMLQALAERAVAAGFDRLRGTYVPSPKNAMVVSLYERLGFILVGGDDGTTMWELDLTAGAPIENPFITTTIGGAPDDREAER